MEVTKIRETLKKALRELNPSSKWPVNVHAILSRVGIGLRFSNSRNKVNSCLEIDNGPTIVIYRPNPALFLSPRERFSIAHELAHWVIWRRFGSLPESDSEYWFHETLCNEFAAGLLVPHSALEQFLQTQNHQGIHPVYFPSRVVQLAAVSWEVAARSIATYPSSDSAYLRLDKAPLSNAKAASKTRQLPLKVSCSTIMKIPGTYLGRSSLVRDEVELLEWMNGLANRKSESRSVTLSLGSLHLREVPCTVLREADRWIMHFRRSSSGIEIEQFN
ncbi:MAG: ImmA/IrrE family metallo-endopeptidase [Pyrinomonadaceae bacterium]